MKKIYLLSLCFVAIFKMVSGQDAGKKLISVDFNQAKIESFVSDLESKTGFHFYYSPAQFDSLKVTLHASNKTLEQVLDMAFSKTDYHYTIKDQLIFLTKGRRLYTDLAVGFFNAPAVTNEGEKQPTAAVDYTDETEKKVAEATTENKIYEIGIRTNNIKSGTATLAGYVRNIKTGEAIIGASVFDPDSKVGLATDQFGYYSLTLARGRHTLLIRGLGMKDTRRKIILYSDGKLNIEMQEQVTSLKEVQISAEKVANVRSVEMGVNKLDIKSIKQIPTAFGEADVLKVVLTLPGVQTVGEATTGFNVRGGSADQNLILLNDATIYNPSHFFGFFSAFDPDIVKNIELYKSTIPEKYGGRLSSVLDVTDRDGNTKKFTGSAGIGLLTSRLNIEGPIIKDKTSFIFGGRTTYSDWLLSLLPNAYKNSSASFYDLNLGITSQLDDKNTIYLMGYMSKDNFRLNSDTTYAYSNKNANIKWKHNFNNKLYSVVLAGIDHYDYSIASTENPIDGYKLNFGINQYNFKTDFSYYVNPKNTIDFGLSGIYYKLNPGNEQPDGAKSLVIPDVVAQEQAMEDAIYLGDKYDITSDLSISAGIRYSLYAYLGPQTVDHYAPNLPKEAVNVTDSTTYGKNKIINTYSGPELRLSARYNIGDDMSVKAAYNSMRQYIHLVSNTTAISPTDSYKLSDPNIKPQLGQQISLGWYRNAKANTIETSIEVYYKTIANYLDYRSGATLLLNQHIEQDLINTKGKAYGVEFLVRKTAGKLNGWVSYTYSRTYLQQDDPFAGELINNGDWYPASYDKPHDFNFNGNYRFSHRFSVSLDVTYSTGRPITLPIAKYGYGGSERVFYSDRNAYRIPDYFRTDFSMNIEGNHRVHQLTHNSWSIGVYNLTGRANAYSTFFSEQGGVINGYQLSIFAKPIPFINYNIRF
ncbi:MAG TPA: TonB-dependent receptor [Mucilaginibacter sp.]|nr:TonB-dependent receptor [Mucilaginibacter sp.]